MRNRIGFLLILLAVLICAAGIKDAPKGLRRTFPAVSGSEDSFSPPEMPRGTVSVNDAEAEDLIQLPGVGETLAQAILTERELHGKFHYPEDLLTVRGIGPARLNGFRDLLDRSD